MEYDKLMAMEEGDVFYEHGYGMTIRYIALGPARKTYCKSLQKNQYEWEGVSDNGVTINFLITQGLEHYGSDIEFE